MKKAKHIVLVVDDDKSTRDGLQLALERDYEIILAESGDRALSALAQNKIDIMLCDIRMPGMDGLTLLQKALAKQSGLICILLTAYGSVETAVEAMKLGAYDFLTKPLNLDYLEMLIKRAVKSREIEHENVQLKVQLDSKYGLESIVGNSPVMIQLFDTIKQAAPTQATVLIQGESGTGKELVARSIHKLSSRASGPFVAVHCAALSQNLLESEIFGHEKGSFTGAEARRQGRFELADGGTLFLDEISEIDPVIQVKLLRVLEERRFERVGGNKTVEVDIRLIAATNKDLKALVKAGKFREDLFFRLDVVNILIPPLRDRPEDIPLLCSSFIGDFNAKNGKNIEAITQDALGIMTAYDWPGNVRELRNTIEKMVVLSRGPKLTARDIPASIRGSAKLDADLQGSAASKPVGNISDMEKKMIVSAIRKHDGNRTDAAKDLGISRRTLHRKIKEYALDDDGTADKIIPAVRGRG